MFDGTQLGRDIVEATKAYIDRQLAPLRERIAELEAGGVKYCGVWQRSAAYARGSVVTHEGSAWCAASQTINERPGKSDQWQLMVKAGHDGKDAPSKTPGLA